MDVILPPSVFNESSKHTPGPRKSTRDTVRRSLGRRYARERLFRGIGLVAVSLAILFLALLLISIFSRGLGAFLQTEIRLDITFDPDTIDPENQRDAETLAYADYQSLVKNSLRQMFPHVEEAREKRQLYSLISSGADSVLRKMVTRDPTVIGKTVSVWVPAGDNLDMLSKGYEDRTRPEVERRINDRQLAWYDQLREEHRVGKHFNTTLLTAGDSREPELAGILGAVVGSFYTLLITILLALPLGIGAAIYLEEFAPQNRWTDLIEVNINNLAAVPSIVFGLLGLAVFINFFNVPRSSPLVGGLVLSLMTLPVIIIAGRAALKSVPPSIREAALGVGASKLQAIYSHVLPLAMPGMLTGSIIGMARALGESAPLLMIGMVAFIVDIPSGATSPATVLPVQIYLWADSPERAFAERTAAAIIVLLLFMLIMNGLAVILRKRYERRW